MARRAKRRPKKEQKVKLTLDDFQFPGEKKAYWQGVGITVGLFAWIALMVYVFRETIFGAQLYTGGFLDMSWQFWWIEFVLLTYPWLTIFAANLLATRHSAQDIKDTGRQRKVMPNNFPDLYRKLSRFAKLADMKRQPDMYLLDDPAAYSYTIPGRPGTIVASEGLSDGLEENEFAALIAHQMGRMKAHHVRTELAITYVQNANPIFQILLFPIWMIKIFSGGWQEVTDFTADRFAMLLMDSSSVVNRALVKKAALADAQADITTEELQNYLDSTGDISTDAKQMERHFRLSNFISQQPNLQERIEALREFAAEAAGQEAMAKMEKIRLEIEGTQPDTG